MVPLVEKFRPPGIFLRGHKGDLGVLVIADHVAGDRAGIPPVLRPPLGAATTFRLPRELAKPVS